MTEFRYSICEPLNPKVIEKGMIAPDSVIGLFNDFQWDYYLKQIEVAETRKMDIYFSPSLEVENKANKNGLTISAVGDPEDPEFYIFYKRPISVVKKQFFVNRKRSWRIMSVRSLVKRKRMLLNV
jgi:hypothetical protein